MQALLNKLKSDFPEVKFKKGHQFRWAPAEQTITYNTDHPKENAIWAMFHELAHAQLRHDSYSLDIELLLMEVAAWDQAKKLATSYGVIIDDDHIQDCLDTYRDWLDQRSTCPACANNSLQRSPDEYKCYNCLASWHVSTSRFCRPYRQKARGKKKASPALSGQTTFQ